MKSQIILIHGGDTYDTYEEYLTFLKNVTIETDYFTKQSWKQSLAERLGEGVEVLAPSMPNKLNAKYEEWKIWFEKLIPFFEPEIILVGHSLGGIFLVKYLAENILPRKIKGIFLVAPPFDDKNSEYSLADFVLPHNFKRLQQQCSAMTFYQSSDDDVVPYADFEKYKQVLPKAMFKSFTDRGHFSQEEFPELVEDVKALIAASQ